MDKRKLKFKEKKFVSSKLYTAVIKDEDDKDGWWNFGEGSGISKYLSEITSDKGYFSRGNISVQIKLDQNYKSFMIDEEHMKYHEQVNLSWLLDSEEPSKLISMITEEFGFKEIK